MVTDNFCNGYWLRSPMGNADANSGYAYIVDLVNGMIRPEAVKPDGGSTDEELRGNYFDWCKTSLCGTAGMIIEN